MEFGLFFLGGACLHYFQDVWKPRPVLAGLILIGLSLLSKAAGHEYIAILISLPYLVILIGRSSVPVIRDAGRWRDLSYGFYIYAWPVQQTVVWLTGNTLGVVEGGAIAPSVALILAYASWHLVEKPMLGLKRLLHPAGERAFPHIVHAMAPRNGIAKTEDFQPPNTE